MPVKIICKICGKTFEVKPYRKKSAKVCSYKCRYQSQKGQTGSKSNSWKGGKYNHGDGYIYIHKPNHPFCNKQGYVFEHRLVVEKHLGRYLKPKERVHHLNKIVSDNHIKNLMLFKNGNYHRWFHKKGFCNLKGIIFDGRILL